MYRLKTPYYKTLYATIIKLGGMFNAHLHLDRAGTIALRYLAGAHINPFENSHTSLAQKHGIIPAIHSGPAYEQEDLSTRVNHYLDIMAEVGTTRANTFVDVSCDRVGLTALELMLEIKRQRKDKLDLRVGAYSPLGFNDSEPERWQLLEEGGQHADFLGSLPERDDCNDYPDHIGFEEHCRRMLLLGQRLEKPVHIHIDQRNDPAERGTEMLLKAIRSVGTPFSESSVPMVWLVHVISPSTYTEARFKTLLDGLTEHNIGVICCPSAALSMRQLRPLQTPTGNSIARILEMLAAGIHVRLGSDNIADICLPAGTANLLDEVFVLANTLRFYNVSILAKLAAGVRLDAADRKQLVQHLEQDNHEVELALLNPSQKDAEGL